MYLATVTKFEIRHGTCYIDPYARSNKYDYFYGMEDDDVDERETYYKLTNWKGVNNDLKIFGQQDLDEKEMLIDEEEMFQKNYELEKCYIEYDGDGGCCRECIYKKTAIVISTKNFAFLLACKKDLSSVIVKCKSDAEQGNEWKIFCGIVDYIKRNDESKMQLKNNNNVASIVDIICSFENKIESANFFLEALRNVGLPNESSADALANLINNLSWESLEANVLK